jgi:hypothetical protein
METPETPKPAQKAPIKSEPFAPLKRERFTREEFIDRVSEIVSDLEYPSTSLRFLSTGPRLPPRLRPAPRLGPTHRAQHEPSSCDASSPSTR